MIRFVEFVGITGHSVYVCPEHVTCVLEECGDFSYTKIYVDDNGEAPIAVKEDAADVVRKLAETKYGGAGSNEL